MQKIEMWVIFKIVTSVGNDLDVYLLNCKLAHSLLLPCSTLIPILVLLSFFLF